MSFSQKLQTRWLFVTLTTCWFSLFTFSVFSQSSIDVELTPAELTCLTDKKVLRVCVDPDRLVFAGVDENGKHDRPLKDYFQNINFTLLWLPLVVLATILIVSLFWKRRLALASRKIRETLDDLHDAQAQLKEQTLLFRQQSITDRLTGLYCRIKLDDDIAYAVKRTKRIKSEFSIILLDIDNFKQVNDSFGHLIGDWVLKAFSTLLKKAIRESDIIGRWGGEKFLIICPDTGLEGGQILAEKLRQRIERCNFPEIGRISASFGVTVHRVDGDPNTLVARVDKALYRAKEQGRNRVEIEAG